jgi:glyceraldehyde-3-phosphate dehydrogenase/erythrose-4-phosphate dehydrogenase
MTRVAINCFGTIGRNFLFAHLERRLRDQIVAFPSAEKRKGWNA